MMWRRTWMAVLACLCAPAHAAKSPVIDSFTLDNGMEVVVVENHRVPAVSHMLWIRVGSADDPPGKSGLAHYHEHMMFQGTTTLKPGEYADIIAREGGQQNAFTGHDVTSYYVNIAKEKLPRIMELEADRLRALKPSDEGAAKEKQVIIEERRQRVENIPSALLAEQVSASLFRHHPYHIPVIGWMHEMEKLTKDDVLKFHQTYYHPNNALLVVSGDITAAELKPLAEKYYGGLPRGDIPARRWQEEPPQNVERRLTMRHANVKQPAWSRVYAADSMVYGNSKNALPLFVLAHVLGGGKTSRLYQSLVVERKLASAVSADFDGFSIGPGEFRISLVPEQNISVETVENALDEELEKIARDGFMPDELNRAKVLLKAESIYTRDGLASMARVLGWLRILGLPSDYFERWNTLVEAVTKEQVSDAMRATLLIDRSVTASLLPAAKEAP